LSVAAQDDRDEMRVCVERGQDSFDLRDANVLPPPDRSAVERFVVDAYMSRHPRSS
jgi:hypothetical protein